jgi:sugar phosphate isomerase/epimerase
MAYVSRRQALIRTAAAAASADWLPALLPKLHAYPLDMPVGCQTYPVRALIAQDLPGTMKILGDAGFQRVELCSPVGYAREGFGDIAKYKGAELRKVLQNAGLKCVSAHFSIEELRTNMEASIAWAKEVGLTQMMVPSLDGPKQPTMDDVKRAADDYNKLGEQSAGAGIQQGLHNEGFELSSVDGQRTYDLLFQLLDPKLVKFQFQCSTITRGFDPAAYFTKYPGRFISMHVQDWSAQEHKMVPVGQGGLDWKKIFAAAKVGGVRNYFVEMNLDAMKASVPYLRRLNA